MTEHNLLDAMIKQAKQSKKQTNKQQKVVETAITMFAERGYANTSTSEIAKAAGVAEGTVFRHYGTKENLLLSVILPFIKESLPSMADDVFEDVLSQNVTGFEGFLRALIKNRLDFLQENKEIFQIVVKEFLYREELRKELFPYLSENIGERLVSKINHYKQQGEIIDISSSDIQRMMFTFMGGYFVSRFVLLPDLSVHEKEKEVEILVRFIMDGIRS